MSEKKETVRDELIKEYAQGFFLILYLKKLVKELIKQVSEDD